MVKQGTIIEVNFNLRTGHEQAGYRPAVVVSNDLFNKKTNMVIVCPIINTINRFPLHVLLDERTETTGCILCEHIRSIDIEARGYKKVELLPDDILQQVINIIFAEVDNPE